MREVLAAGAARDGLSYRGAAHARRPRPRGRRRSPGSPATASRATSTPTTRRSASSTGAASPLDLRSRTDDDPRLRGTKQRVATEREVTVTRGRSDGRTVVIVPEVKGAQTVGLTLLHLELRDRLPADVARSVLPGYRNRYARAAAARSPRPSPTFDDARARRRSTSSTCSPCRSTSSPTAGATWPPSMTTVPARRARDRGLGTDLVEVERFRLALRTPRRRSPSGCSATRAGVRVPLTASRCRASRRGSAPRKR